MKKTSFIITLILVVVVTWLGFSMMNVQKAINRPGILLSPNKSKSVEIFGDQGRSQAFMNFHKGIMVGGSNITAGNFEKNQIVMEWQDENTLILKAPKDTKFFNREDEVYFFGDLVTIKYEKLNK